MGKLLTMAALVMLVLAGAVPAEAQRWVVGGNSGVSSFGGSMGIHITPMAEMLFNRSFSVGSEFSLNTQYGTPLIIHPYAKYYIPLQGSQLLPYADAGPLVALNAADGICLGALFGGGVNIPVGNRLFIAPDLQAGPVFGVGRRNSYFIIAGSYWGYNAYSLALNNIPGVTAFLFYLRCGIRYEI